MTGSRRVWRGGFGEVQNCFKTLPMEPIPMKLIKTVKDEPVAKKVKKLKKEPVHCSVEESCEGRRHRYNGGFIERVR